MWHTRKWLLRSLILIIAVSSIFLIFQHEAKEAAELRYKQNNEYAQKMESKGTSTRITKKAKRSHNSQLVNTTKPVFMSWYMIVLYVAIGSTALSAFVQRWGWKPIFNLLLLGLIIGAILTIMGVRMDSAQRR